MLLKFNLLNSILPDVFRNELSRKEKSVLLKLGHYSAEDLKKKKIWKINGISYTNMWF